MAQDLVFGNNHGAPLVIWANRDYIMYSLGEEGAWVSLSSDLFSPLWGSILFTDKAALRQTIDTFNMMLEEWEKE